MNKKNKKGPSIRVQFYIEDSFIKKIDVSSSDNKGLSYEVIGQAPDSLIKAIDCWFSDYTSKREPSVVLPLDMSKLPSFTQKVLINLQRISFGKSLSYSDIAEVIHHPLACRAVGTACGKNPYPLIIPCHRVLAKGQRLGGFSCGLEVKKELLFFEEILYH